MGGMAEESNKNTAVGNCLSIGAGWVAFCLIFGLLNWAASNTGLPVHIVEFYRYLRDLRPEPYDFTALLVVESATFCFISLPAFLVGLMIYQRCIAGIRTFSLRSALVATAFVSVILGIAAGDPMLAVERWRGTRLSAVYCCFHGLSNLGVDTH